MLIFQMAKVVLPVVTPENTPFTPLHHVPHAVFRQHVPRVGPARRACQAAEHYNEASRGPIPPRDRYVQTAHHMNLLACDVKNPKSVVHRCGMDFLVLRRLLTWQRLSTFGTSIRPMSHCGERSQTRCCLRGAFVELLLLIGNEAVPFRTERDAMSAVSKPCRSLFNFVKTTLTSNPACDWETRPCEADICVQDRNLR